MQIVRPIRFGYGLYKNFYRIGNLSILNYSNVCSNKQIHLINSMRNRHFPLCCFMQEILPPKNERNKPSSCGSFKIHRKGYGTSHNQKQQKEIETEEPEPEKLSLVKRYKKMLKEYWYVLIPVHMVTSTMWFGMFYYVATTGFDIIPYLEMLSLPESIIKPLRNPLLGYIAVASALYKIATPARYMLTLGGTTYAIKYLTKRGLIKPVPTKDKFKSIIKKKLQSAKDS